MKFFVIVFAACIVSAFAGITDEQRMKLKEYKTACIAETGVDEAVINNVKNGNQVEFDDKMNCFSACMFKKIGIMRPDGTIDDEVARAKAPQDLPMDKVDQVLETCKAQVGKDNCETGGKILSCLLKTKASTILD